MAKLNSIARFLNKELNIRKISDSSKNGLQIKHKIEIKKVGFAVDACLAIFKKAKRANIDLLVVHHGLLWKHQKHKELLQKRENFLQKNKIALYGVHLPLDAHRKYGNNIKLCEILRLTKIKKFGKYHGFTVGYHGELPQLKTPKAIANILNRSIKTRSKIYQFGKKKIKTVAIVSGRGIDALDEAIKKNIDLFITGEISHSTYNNAQDGNMNLIQAGHYATETLGVKALMPLIKEKFNIQTVFINHPTGL